MCRSVEPGQPILRTEPEYAVSASAYRTFVAHWSEILLLRLVPEVRERIIPALVAVEPLRRYDPQHPFFIFMDLPDR
jgi:hypothetical protein